MAIKINGVEIETGKFYNEYSKEELELLPPLDANSKNSFVLGADGDWYLDTTD